MSESDTPPPSQAEVDAALNPDFLSHKQIAAVKILDAKNLDREDYQQDMASLIESLLNGYESARKPK